jgi:hypothetical protein
MSAPTLEGQIRGLIVGGGFVEAERLLRAARSEAANASDPEALEEALNLLVDVYALQEPPNIASADVVCLEREELTKTAYSKLQTAMVRYWAVGAADAIAEIERMIADRKQIIVGDETLLLETARDRGLSLAHTSRIAAVLAPVCHDPEFARRLNALRTDQ